MPDPKELSGWKEIAAHLDVSVRTAQAYEKNQRLPVHHLPGQKGRVFGNVEELNTWRRAGVRRPSRRVFAIIAASVVALVAGVYFLVIPHGPPTGFRVEGRNLIVTNAKGRVLWTHPFEVPLQPSAYPPERLLSQTWLGDLDGDGRPELLFVEHPLNQADVGSKVLCFADNGKTKWSFTPGRPVRDRGSLMVLPYYTSHLQVIIGKTSAETRVAVSSVHNLDQPCQVAFLDIHGKVVGEYWHPGHMYESRVVDLNHDGRKELVLAGVNNGMHQATLVVLDPLKIVGLMTPKEMLDHRFEIMDMAAAKEESVVFFPRSCISRGQPFTRAHSLRVTNERVIVTVAEGYNEGYPGFDYQLDYGLNVVDIGPDSPNTRLAHQALEARGEVDHPFSTECDRLKAAVIVRR